MVEVIKVFVSGLVGFTLGTDVVVDVVCCRGGGLIKLFSVCGVA